MKPFFSYYGSKYRLCQTGFYPKSKMGNIVVEPFAGSACYSIYHEPEIAILIDKNPTIIGVWNYLINAQEADILELPTNLDDFESLLDMKNYFNNSAIDLIGFWVGKGKTTPVHHITKWWKKYHSEKCCRVWNEYTKQRIIKQLPKIRNWHAFLNNYDSDINQLVSKHHTFDKQHLSGLSKQSITTNATKWGNALSNQTYFIDPPYSGLAGRAYQHNKINYQDLKTWIDALSNKINTNNENNKSNKNQIIACENQDLKYRWANFNQTVEAFNMRGKKQELAWVQP